MFFVKRFAKQYVVAHIAALDPGFLFNVRNCSVQANWGLKFLRRAQKIFCKLSELWAISSLVNASKLFYLFRNKINHISNYCLQKTGLAWAYVTNDANELSLLNFQVNFFQGNVFTKCLWFREKLCRVGLLLFCEFFGIHVRFLFRVYGVFVLKPPAKVSLYFYWILLLGLLLDLALLDFVDLKQFLDFLGAGFGLGVKLLDVGELAHVVV